MLKSIEVSARTADDAVAKALAQLTEMQGGADPYRVLFLDWQMPDLDGVEFMRHLAQMRYAGSLVLVSGEDGRTLHFARRLAEAHGIRVVGALGKPLRSFPHHVAPVRYQPATPEGDG